MQGLDKTQKKVIQLAACCRWFNKSLIKYLVAIQELEFDKIVDPKLNCFEWLVKLDFVEFTQNTHRLDDVARDVFRLSLWQEDQDQFRQINDLLAKYYEDKAKAEVAPDSSPPRMYENREWREYIAESLYHALFARQEDWENKFMSHLFSGCYLQETAVVTIPFNAITAEINVEDNVLLSSAVKNFLQAIKLIFDVKCLVFEEQKLVNSLNEYIANYFDEELSSDAKLDNLIEQYKLRKQLDKLFAGRKIDDAPEKLVIKRKYFLSLLQELSFKQVKTNLEPALEYCFNRIDSLTGLAKFAGLLYKIKHSPQTQQLGYLQQAKSQANKIIVNFDSEFSSGLFLWNLGGIQFNLGRLDEAISSYDKAIEIKPDKYEAWYNRGVALGNLGRLDEAISSYDKALEIKPDYGEAWNNRGIILGSIGKLDEALASFDKAIEIKPDYGEAWNSRGIALGNLGRLDEAIADYDKALEIKPDKDQAWYNRGNALANLGRDEDAIASYDKAIEIKPDKDQAWYNRGNALANLGRYEEAIASYDKALEFEPNYDEAWYNRGIALGNLDRLDEAIVSYNKALEINPDYDKAWNNCGVDLSNLRRYEEAIVSYNKALEINPDYDEAWYNRACYFALQNQIESAIENLAKAISFNNKYQEMAKTDTDFDNIREDARFKALVC